MPNPVFLDVDPRTLHLPPSSRYGRRSWQVAAADRSVRHVDGRHARSLGLPGLRRGVGNLRWRDSCHARVAKLLPGILMRVEVIGDQRTPVGQYSTVGDRLP